jgi:hypothetical protein
MFFVKLAALSAVTASPLPHKVHSVKMARAPADVQDGLDAGRLPPHPNRAGSPCYCIRSKLALAVVSSYLNLYFNAPW